MDIPEPIYRPSQETLATVLKTVPKPTYYFEAIFAPLAMGRMSNFPMDGPFSLSDEIIMALSNSEINPVRAEYRFSRVHKKFYFEKARPDKRLKMIRTLMGPPESITNPKFSEIVFTDRSSRAVNAIDSFVQQGLLEELLSNGYEINRFGITHSHPEGLLNRIIYLADMLIVNFDDHEEDYHGKYTDLGSWFNSLRQE
jgi:hypothetical protein